MKAVEKLNEVNLIEHKNSLRQRMLSKRDTLPKEFKADYDEWICEKLWELILFQKAKTVHCFLPMGSEINHYPLIEKMLQAGIKVVCPRSLKKPRMEHLELRSLQELRKGIFNTRYPADSIEFHGTYDLIIVPGLAFDQKKGRLGYGGGYYDNFLAQCSNSYMTAPCYPFQIVDSVPMEPHDQRVDCVLVK